MLKLETCINTVLEQLKSELADETWVSRRRYFNQMLKMAKSLNIIEPCQALYDAFIADDNGSKERRSLHICCVKLIDAAAGTKAKDDRNIFYNSQDMPDEKEVNDFFQKLSISHSTNTVSIDYIIVKAEIEMRHLSHAVSTAGQYWHSWMDIRQYFMNNGTADYNEAILQQYICENDTQCNNGFIQQWKRKINRKAAYVLMEVAKTGSFNWSKIQKSISCNKPELEAIRSQYRNIFTQKNLSASTICLHDYVFRKSIEFSGINNSEDLAELSGGQIQNIISEFAEICNSRSMSTILPILRSMLHTFYEMSWVEKNLSGMVMSGFIQKGSVAAYLSEKDEVKLVAQLEFESKRNKAIILLALRLGLRDCDICSLTLNAVDWHRDKLCLTQKKTGEPMILPLLPDVGNALMDYIVNERPHRHDNYPYVFLRSLAPHNKLSSAYPLCSKLFARLNIKPVNGTQTGIHVFRYSIAHKLLTAKVPSQVITDALGHNSKESDKPYISMDESMLKMCALDLTDTGRISWVGVDI